MKNLILLRGLVRHHRHWWGFPDILKSKDANLKIYTLDFPGVGTEYQSRAPLSVAEMRQDVSRRFHEKIKSGEWPEKDWSIVAISLGGMVAMDWLDAEPHLFQRAVLISSSTKDAGKFYERFNLRILPRMIRELMWFRPLSSERLIFDATVNIQRENSEDRLKKLTDWRTEFPLKKQAFLAQVYAGSQFRLPKNIQTKTLVLTSKADRLVSHECSLRISEHLNAPIYYHDRAGHDLSLDAPEWLADQIVNFFKAEV